MHNKFPNNHASKKWRTENIRGQMEKPQTTNSKKMPNHRYRDRKEKEFDFVMLSI